MGRGDKSSKVGLFDVRKISHCQGEFECRNSECPYYAQFNKYNKRTKSKGGKKMCKFCDGDMDVLECDAIKVCEFFAKHVVVKHHGIHTPVPSEDRH